MLVLSRRLNEKILFPDFQAAVEVVALQATKVRLGIQAPAHVKVLREELQARDRQWGETPAQSGAHFDRLDSRAPRLFVCRQLDATEAAVKRLRRQLLAGQTHFAEPTLARLAEDLQSLRERLEDATKGHEPATDDFICVSSGQPGPCS